MLTKFIIDPGNNINTANVSLYEAIWVDILKPTPKERELISKELNILLPLHHELHQIEFSNRFYIENNAIYLSVSALTKASPIPESHIVNFILTQNKIITLRFSDPNPIQMFINEVKKRQIPAQNHIDIFLLLLNKLMGTNADMFELVGEQSDELSLSLTGAITNESPSQHTKKLNKILRKINYLQHLSSKCYQSLTSLKLALSYLHEVEGIALNGLIDKLHLSGLEQDIKNLMKHGEYLTQKLNFELQSTLGLINIEQTSIIKIFTVLAMIFMPPTLIASLYGMNFHHMPELSAKWGYPLAIGIMFATALIPYSFFKKKGWI